MSQGTAGGHVRRLQEQFIITNYKCPFCSVFGAKGAVSLLSESGKVKTGEWLFQWFRTVPCPGWLTNAPSITRRAQPPGWADG